MPLPSLEQPSCVPILSVPPRDAALELCTEMSALEMLLAIARRGGQCAELREAGQLAYRAHGTAERAGLSEAANALLYVHETLLAMLSGEIVPIAVNWRQVDAAWRSAQSLSRPSLVPRAPPVLPSARRIVVIERGTALASILSRRTGDERFEIVTATTYQEVSTLMSAVDVAVVEWSAGQEPLDPPGPHERRARIVVVGDDDGLDQRLAAARAGAEVYLTRREAPRQLRAAVRALVARSEPRRVLIVARPETARLARQSFDTTAFALSCTSDVRQLLEKIQSFRPDALVVDAGLEPPGAVELCRVLRAAPRWQDLPITVVSAADTGLRHTTFQAGADDFAVLTTDAEQLVWRIDALIDRVDRAHAQASRDVLTGLMTRRAFSEAVEARLAEARRAKKYLSVCVIDIDHFKKINDTHGHAAGDEVLATLGGLFNSRLRLEDLRGRWGGEEFIVALFDEWSESARQVLSRLTTELSSLRFTGTAGERFSITVSAGIATFPVDGDSLDELFRAADARLYAAKSAGRNRIVV